MADFLNYPYGNPLFEPVRSTLWKVDFSDTPLTEIAQTKLVLLAREISLPEIEHGVIKDNYLNKGMIYAGIQDMTGKSVNIKFINTYDERDARAILTEWLRRQFDPQTGLQNYLSTYKGNIKIHLLNLDYTIFKSFILYNAFPKKIGDFKLSYGAKEDLPSLDVTFNYTHHVEIGTTPNPSAR